jgi:hypothetical protein
MDTHVHPKVYGYRREDFVESKEELMDRSRVIAREGKGALMENMLRDYRRAESAGPGESPAS